MGFALPLGGHIESQDDFELLWETGFFASVGNQLGIFPDDYEEGEIEAEMVPRLREIASSYLKRGVGGPVGERFVLDLVGACDVAESKNQPVYFVL